DVIYLIRMGRIPTNSQRLNCRINRRAADRLNAALARVGGKRKPIGRMLSLLILKTEPEIWREVIRMLPKQSRREMTMRDLRRIAAERGTDQTVALSSAFSYRLVL